MIEEKTNADYAQPNGISVKNVKAFVICLAKHKFIAQIIHDDQY